MYAYLQTRYKLTPLLMCARIGACILNVSKHTLDVGNLYRAEYKRFRNWFVALSIVQRPLMLFVPTRKTTNFGGVDLLTAAACISYATSANMPPGVQFTYQLEGGTTVPSTNGLSWESEKTATCKIIE